MRLTLTVLALAAAAFSPLAAANTSEMVTVTINYDGIDLSTAEGRAAFEARLNAEARVACTVEKGLRYGYKRKSVDQTCFNDARNAALAEAQRVVANETRSGGAIAAN